MSNTITTDFRAKVSKLGKAQLESKIAKGAFKGEELKIAKEIANKRNAKSTPANAKPTPAPKATKGKAKAEKTTKKAAKAEGSKNYGKSEFVRDLIVKGIRSHSEVAKMVFNKFGSKLYYSEYDRCRKKVDQRPSDKK